MYTWCEDILYFNIQLFLYTRQNNFFMLYICRDILLLGKGQNSFPDVLRQLSGDLELANFLQRERTAEWVMAKRLSRFQNAMIALLQKRADSLMDYVYKISAPAEACRSPENFADWLVDQVRPVEGSLLRRYIGLASVPGCHKLHPCHHFMLLIGRGRLVKVAKN